MALTELSVKLAIVLSGAFLMVGMLTGVWKYAQMMRSPDHRAGPYVDIAHRSSLLYAPATLILGALSALSTLPIAVETACVAGASVFFAIAIGSYIIHGLGGRRETQFSERNFSTTFGTYALIVVEVGAVAVLLYGAVLACL